MKSCLSSPLFPAVLLVATLLPACGSSDTPAQQAPPGGGELPVEFAVFFQNREASGNLLATGDVPHLFDFTTGELNSVAEELLTDEAILQNSASLSPNGRYLFFSLGSTEDPRLYAVDLKERTSRRVPLPAAPGSGSTLGGDGVQPRVGFSSDSSQAWIFANSPVSFGGATYVASADGGNLRRVQIGGFDVNPVGWVGDSSRFMVLGYDDASQSEALGIVDANGALGSLLVPVPGEDVAIDDVSIARDGSIVAMIVAIFPPGSDEIYRLVTFDLDSGVRSEFDLPGLDGALPYASDDGRYVAVYTEGSPSQAEDVWIAEVATGLTERVTLPNSHGMGISIDDGELLWEPGGSRIAFVSNHRDEPTDEITIAEFGTMSYAIDPSVIAESQASEVTWAPTGRYLAFSRDLDEDRLVVFDADSTAPPQVPTDLAVSTDARDLVWSPDGSRLLVTAREISTNSRKVFVYSAPDFTRLGTLGAGWPSSYNSGPFASDGLSVAAFSSDSRHVLWRPESASDRLLSASIDTLTGTTQNIAAGAPSGSTAPIGQFWLRR